MGMMTKSEARRILNVSEEESPKDIKKKYREHALLWHPDKNREPEATEKFQRIQEAYQYLMKSVDDPVEIESYRTMLFAFIRDNLPDGIDSEKFVYVIEIILNRLKRICENNAISFFDNINIELLTRIYNILLSLNIPRNNSSLISLLISDILPTCINFPYVNTCLEISSSFIISPFLCSKQWLYTFIDLDPTGGNAILQHGRQYPNGC